MRIFGKRIHLPPVVSFGLSKGAVYLGAGVVPILLFDASPRLGFWWFILFLAYVALLIWLRAKLLWRRERVVLLRDLGPEQFYAVFPREKKLDERRARRAAKRKARLVSKQSRRSAPVPWEPRR